MSKLIDDAIADAKSAYDRVRITGPADQTDILLLNKLIGTEIPIDYMYFLKNYGTFGFYGLEIYGLIKGNIDGEGPPNAFFMTKTDIDDKSIPAGHIVIYSTGYGPICLLKCADGSVIEWDYSQSIDHSELSAASFEQFLHDRTKETIADLVRDRNS